MNFDFILEWGGVLVPVLVSVLVSMLALGGVIVWYASQAWGRLKRVEDRVDDHEKHCAERHKKTDERFNRIDETMGEMQKDIAAMKVNLDWLVSQARQGDGAGPPTDE